MAEDDDKYLTVKGVSTGIFRDRGSRFLAFAHNIASVEESKEILDKYRKEYHDARHHCYAYIIGADRSIQRQSDDGEPQGTAGKPILGQINARNLTNTMVVVVRYFGGTLLGTGGLINAYKTASAEALNKAEIIECYVLKHLEINFPYKRLNAVMRILNDLNCIIESQQFMESCTIRASIRKSHYTQVMSRLQEYQDIELKLF